MTISRVKCPQTACLCDRRERHHPPRRRLAVERSSRASMLLLPDGLALSIRMPFLRKAMHRKALHRQVVHRKTSHRKAPHRHHSNPIYSHLLKALWRPSLLASKPKRHIIALQRVRRYSGHLYEWTECETTHCFNNVDTPRVTDQPYRDQSATFRKSARQNAGIAIHKFKRLACTLKKVCAYFGPSFLFDVAFPRVSTARERCNRRFSFGVLRQHAHAACGLLLDRALAAPPVPVFVLGVLILGVISKSSRDTRAESLWCVFAVGKKCVRGE